MTDWKIGDACVWICFPKRFPRIIERRVGRLTRQWPSGSFYGHFRKPDGTKVVGNYMMAHLLERPTPDERAEIDRILPPKGTR